MKRIRRLSLMTLAASSFALLGMQESATAAVLFHGSECQYSNAQLPIFPAEGNGQMINPYSGNDNLVTLICPADKIPNEAASSVTVSVHQNGGSLIAAKACVTFVGGGGGSCGTAGTPSGTGVRQISVQTSTWSTFSTSYRYLEVRLPPCTGGSCNVLFGYTQN